MSSAEQRDIRFAPENHHYRNTQRPSMFLTRSHHAHLELLNFVNEDYIAGYTQDGQMSTVRRFFCLFVAFDLFFISMLWFICIMINGDTVLNALKVQVIQYSICTSLFDIILVAFIRFSFLILFYGILAINHWSIITFTTTASCAFLIGKVLYYNWLASAQPIIQVLMIIVSCLLAWGEAWFLDFRVIPQEKNSQRFYRLLLARLDDNERSPLLDSFLNTINNVEQTDSSVANFYTPIQSEGDENEFYNNKAIADAQAALELIECIDWKHEKIIKTTGDRIQSISRKNFGKIYRVTGQMNLSAKKLLNILYYGIEEMPTWNPTVLESKILKKVDNHTDITYSVSTPSAGGLVESRDFVTLRSWHVIRNGNIVEDDVLEMSDDKTPTNEIPYRFGGTFQKDFRSTSESNLTENQISTSSSIMDQSAYTLSRSLGAKVLFTERLLGSKSNNEEFVDTIDSQGAHSTIDSNMRSYQSNEKEHITEVAQELCDKIYLVTGVSIKYDQMPKVAEYVRGENLMACWSIRESNTNPNTCTFDWILCIDLKGRFLRMVLDKAYTSFMTEFMSHLRKYCESYEVTA